jgi:phosphoribosyl 1,2-cyclic phosphate phosphodiesterase
LKITFLGTGTSQGVPVIGCNCEVCTSLDFRDKRLRSSIHISINKNSYVIDTGPDFRQQVLRESIANLDAVIFTHAHKDHTAGLDDVRAFNFKQGIDMPVYGTVEVHEQLKREFAYAFNKEYYPGVPRLELKEIGTEKFEIKGVEFIPLPVMHMKLPVLGFRIGNFSYITDANYVPDDTLNKLIGTKTLVLNALQIDKHISHFNLEEAIAMVAQINPEKAYFTHISHKLGQHKQIEKRLPENVALAYDGLQIQV